MYTDSIHKSSLDYIASVFTLGHFLVLRMSIEEDQMNFHRENGSIFSRRYLSRIFALFLCGAPAAFTFYVNSELAALIHLVIALLGSVRSPLYYSYEYSESLLNLPVLNMFVFVYLYIDPYTIVHGSTFKILETCGMNQISYTTYISFRGYCVLFTSKFYIILMLYCNSLCLLYSYSYITIIHIDTYTFYCMYF